MNKKKLTTKETFALAVQNQQKNNLQVAENLYKETLRINPNHLESNFLLGTLSAQIKKFNEAVSDATFWGNSVTEYAGSFRSAKLKAEQYMKSALADLDSHIENSKKHPERFQPVPDGYREKAEKELKRRVEFSETIYEN